MSALSPLLLAIMVASGVYLHRQYAAAEETLAEAQRLDREARGRLQQVEQGLAGLAREREALEARKADQIRHLAELDLHQRTEVSLAAEAYDRQARALQQQQELDRQRLVAWQQQIAAQQQAQESQRMLEHQRLAAAEAQLHATQGVLAQTQQQVLARPATTTVIWSPAPHVHVHHEGKSLANPVPKALDHRTHGCTLRLVGSSSRQVCQ